VWFAIVLTVQSIWALLISFSLRIILSEPDSEIDLNNAIDYVSVWFTDMLVTFGPVLVIFKIIVETLPDRRGKE